MKLPKTTRKQQEILKLLYRYRFLNRIQIQTLMGHKDRKTVNIWLRDLRDKHYVTWIYSTHFAEKTNPAIYYIGINGVRFLKTLNEYPLEDVRKRYREPSRSQTFIDRCLLLADCCINLQQISTNKIERSYVTEADYLNPGSEYFFLSQSELIHPHLLSVKWEHKKGDEVTTNYLLEIFDATLPRYRMKKRLKDYVEYLDEREWQSETGDDEPPIVLLVCPRTTDLIYAKRRTRGLLANIWEYNDEGRPHIRFATIDKLKELGITGIIWEGV